MDELKELDRKVKRPANVFAYVLSSRRNKYADQIIELSDKLMQE